MHLRDFTEWNPFTAFIATWFILVIVFFVWNYLDERRHKKIIQESDKSAKESMERLRR